MPKKGANMFKSFFFKNSALFIFLVNIPLAAATGWNNETTVAAGINDYFVATPVAGASPAMVAVTEKIPGGFKPGQPVKIQIDLHILRGYARTTKKAIELTLKPSPALLSTHPAGSGNGNEYVIAWQQTNDNGATEIRYIYSSDKGNSFTEPEVLPGTSGNRTAILPVVLVDTKRQFHIIFQEETGGGRFTLKHSMGEEGNFNDPTSIVRDIQRVGRGIFFPSVLVTGETVTVFYQNRLEGSLKDEVYKIVSTNSGESYENPQRLTSNESNDFAPSAAFTKEGVQYVWAANPENSWRIYIAGAGYENPEYLTSNSTNAYLPHLAYTSGAGRIVTWYDFRVNPPQVFGIFLDRKSNKSVGEPHQVTKTRVAARRPKMISWGGNAYLFFQSGSNLVMKQADTGASSLKVYSNTHPEGKPRSSNLVRINWNKPSDPSGIESYAYLIDNKKNTTPDIFNLDGARNKLTLENLAGGNYYFHLRYRDNAGNISETAHYNFLIDNLPPSSPTIYSETHKEKIPTKKTIFEATVNSTDDAAIKQYIYGLSRGPRARPREVSQSGKIVIPDLTPGTWYFIVKAQDISGNYSEQALYEIEVTEPEGLRVSFATNINEGVLSDENLSISVAKNQKTSEIKSLYYVVSARSADPFKSGKQVEPVISEQSLDFTVPVKKTGGMMVASVGFVFNNKETSITRHIYFDTAKRKTGPSTSLIAPTKTTRPKAVITDVTTIDDEAIKKLVPSTQVQDQDGVIAISFNIKDKSFRRQLKGFNWQLNRQKELPTLQVNSIGGPEYIYLVQEGTYFLNVRPVFKSDKLNQHEVFQSTRIDIQNRQSISAGMPLWLLISLGFLTVAIVGLVSLKRVRYFLSKIASKTGLR